VTWRLAWQAVLLHLLAAVAVAVGWWQLAPDLTYTVIEGQAYLFDEVASRRIFDSDATFVMLGSAAGLLCAVGLLLAGHRGVIVPALLAGGGLLGSVAAWWLAVQLGPGRLDALAAAVGDGEVVAGPELSAHGALLFWPIVAVAVVLVVAAFSEPEPSPRRRSRASAE
jgi:hypothetical protein